MITGNVLAINSNILNQTSFKYMIDLSMRFQEKVDSLWISYDNAKCDIYSNQASY